MWKPGIHNTVPCCQPGPPALFQCLGLCAGLAYREFYFSGYKCNFCSSSCFWQSVSQRNTLSYWGVRVDSVFHLAQLGVWFPPILLCTAVTWRISEDLQVQERIPMICLMLGGACFSHSSSHCWRSAEDMMKYACSILLIYKMNCRNPRHGQHSGNTDMT